MKANRKYCSQCGKKQKIKVHRIPKDNRSGALSSAASFNNTFLNHSKGSNYKAQARRRDKRTTIRNNDYNPHTTSSGSSDDTYKT